MEPLQPPKDTKGSKLFEPKSQEKKFSTFEVSIKFDDSEFNASGKFPQTEEKEKEETSFLDKLLKLYALVSTNLQTPTEATENDNVDWKALFEQLSERYQKLAEENKILKKNNDILVGESFENAIKRGEIDFEHLKQENQTSKHYNQKDVLDGNTETILMKPTC